MSPTPSRPDLSIAAALERISGTLRAAAADVVEPACTGGGAHRWEIGTRRWRCVRCGFERPPRVPKRRGWTEDGKRPRGRPRATTEDSDAG